MSIERTTEAACPHVDGPFVDPRSSTCEECGSGAALRVCTACGHVGCCESQYGHNTEHYRASGDAVIKPMPVGDDSFTWCYECGRYVTDAGPRPASRGPVPSP